MTADAVRIEVREQSDAAGAIVREVGVSLDHPGRLAVEEYLLQSVGQ